MKALVFVLMFVALTTQVYAAATIADIYSAPSEALVYSGGLTAECRELNISCQDTDYGTIADEYSDIGDGSTSSASGATVKDSGNTQASYLRLVYDLDGILDGAYTLRWARTATTTYSYRICAYANSTSLNQSLCVNGTDTDEEIWHEADIDAIVRGCYSCQDEQRVVLRFYVIEGGSEVVTEMYLKRPYKQGDFQIIASGVSEANVNTRVENTWTIISQAELPEIANASCTIDRLSEINDTVDEVELNVSALNIEYHISPTNAYFEVYWDANESAGVLQGRNYEVTCSGYLGNVYIDEISQFVYVNNQKGILESIQAFFVYILQIIGLLEENQQYINETRDIANETRNIANQTLNLVQGLGGSVSVQPQDIVAYTGQNLTVLSALTVGASPDNAANCKLKVYYPNATVWLDDQNMTAVGDDGLYQTNVVFEDVTGNYQAISTCTGGTLSGSARGLASWVVSDGVKMISIT